MRPSMRTWTRLFRLSRKRSAKPSKFKERRLSAERLEARQLMTAVPLLAAPVATTTKPLAAPPHADMSGAASAPVTKLTVTGTFTRNSIIVTPSNGAGATSTTIKSGPLAPTLVNQALLGFNGVNTLSKASVMSAATSDQSPAGGRHFRMATGGSSEFEVTSLTYYVGDTTEPLSANNLSIKNTGWISADTWIEAVTSAVGGSVTDYNHNVVDFPNGAFAIGYVSQFTGTTGNQLLEEGLSSTDMIIIFQGPGNASLSGNYWLVNVTEQSPD